MLNVYDDNRKNTPLDQVSNSLTDLQLFSRIIKEKYSVADFQNYLEAASKLKVLVIGETIIDEYCYCETIGKSGKEPILAARFLSSEKFAGGVLAIANHVAGFCDKVGVLSFLGSRNSHREFIEKKLNARVERHFLCLENEPTIVKRRYVENYPLQKLFEVYEMNNSAENSSCEASLCAALEKVLPSYDLVIVADYGHGMIDTCAEELICEKARFLSVNTQVNAENRGFNAISKYRRADYVCISENEIRLEARSRTKPIEGIIESVSEKLCCPRLLITQGSSGCLVYSDKTGFAKSPALTQHYVDRIGAGDAVLGITSPLVCREMPADMLGLIGNVIGALAVAVMGNKQPVNKTQVLEYLEAFFAG